MTNTCDLCKKEKSYDPWCCKEALNRAVNTYHKSIAALIYEKTNGLIGFKDLK